MDLLRVLLQTLADNFETVVQEDDMLDDRVTAAITVMLTRFGSQASRQIFIVLDDLDALGSTTGVEEWLPVTTAVNVHWIITTTVPPHVKALTTLRNFDLISLSVDMWDEGFREGLLQSVIKRHKPAVYRDHIEKLKSVDLHVYPDFLHTCMDVLRTCTVDGQADRLTDWCISFQNMTALRIGILRKWCADVSGAQELLAILSLAETGMYEHELVQLLEVPTRLSCANWQELLRTVEEATFVCCGIRTFFNR